MSSSKTDCFAQWVNVYMLWIPKSRRHSRCGVLEPRTWSREGVLDPGRRSRDGVLEHAVHRSPIQMADTAAYPWHQTMLLYICSILLRQGWDKAETRLSFLLRQGRDQLGRLRQGMAQAGRGSGCKLSIKHGSSCQQLLQMHHNLLFLRHRVFCDVFCIMPDGAVTACEVWSPH